MKDLFFTAHSQIGTFRRYSQLLTLHTFVRGGMALLAVLMFTRCQTTTVDWWSISDKDFAEQYVEKAFSANLENQSSVAWMLFARVNQQKQFNGKQFSEWELWPSNHDTFNPSVQQFAPENKIRTRPHLQAPKIFRGQAHTQLSLPPEGGGHRATPEPAHLHGSGGSRGRRGRPASGPSRRRCSRRR